MRGKFKRIFISLIMLFGLLGIAIPVQARTQINKKSATVLVSQSVKLSVKGTDKKVKWSSSNKEIAKVNSSGKVTGKKAGICTITAKANGKTAKCKITVKNPSIKLNKAKATINTSGTTSVQLKATVKGVSSKVTWKSSNKKIATVNSKGVVTAKKAGTVTITVKANGKTAKCKVTVKNKKKKVSEKQKQHRKYVDYIKKFNQNNQKSMEKYKGIMYTGSFSAGTCFAFVDIDKDGTDECIVRFTSRENGNTTDAFTGGSFERTDIYTIKDGNVRHVVEQGPAWCGFYPGVSVYKNSNLIGFYTSGHSLTGYEFYTYANGKLSKLPKYSCCYVMGGSYYINGSYENGRKVTQAEYETYLNQIRANLKGYPMYMYTTANLNKYL